MIQLKLNMKQIILIFWLALVGIYGQETMYAMNWRPEFNAACSKALIHGSEHSIPDTSLTASSSDAALSRMDGPPAWKASSGDSVAPWVMADLGRSFFVTSLVIQGFGSAWISKFSLALGQDNASALHYYEANGMVKEFAGNSAADDVAHVTLDPPVTARFVQLMALEWDTNPVLFWEIRGCEKVVKFGTRLSSTFEDYDSSLAVDVNADGIETCAKVGLQDIPWLVVKLDAIYDVTKVVLSGQACAFEVRVGNTYSGLGRGSGWVENQACFVDVEGLVAGAPKIVSCRKPIHGQIVSVQVVRYDCPFDERLMEICDIQIYALRAGIEELI